MKRRITAYHFRCIAAGAATALLLLIPFGDESRLLQELGNAGHALLFGALSIILLSDRRAGLGRYLRTFLFTLSFGVATELMQWAEGRDAELLDVLRDGLGAAAFLGTAWTLYHPISATRRALIRLAAAAILISVFIPPLLTGAALMHRWQTFPILQDFDSAIAKRFCLPGKAKIDFVAAPWDAGERVLLATFEPAQYSGFAIEGPWPSWANHQELSFAVYSGQPQTIRLNLRIHDARHSNEYSDRFNRQLAIKPGMNTVNVRMSEIEETPRGRKMDLEGIRAIGLFVINPVRSFDLYFGRFQLE